MEERRLLDITISTQVKVLECRALTAQSSILAAISRLDWEGWGAREVSPTVLRKTMFFHSE